MITLIQARDLTASALTEDLYAVEELIRKAASAGKVKVELASTKAKALHSLLSSMGYGVTIYAGNTLVVSW